MRTTAELVNELCEDLEPVKPLWSPAARSSIWLPLNIIYTVTLIALVGSFRPDFVAQVSSSPRLLLESILGIVAGTIATWAAFESMVPGIRWDARKKSIVLFPSVVYLLLNFYGFFNPVFSPSWVGWRPGCETEILAYGTFPVLICFLLAMRAAPTNSGWTGLLVGIAAFSPALVGINIACAYDPSHIVFFHVIPVCMFCAACAFYGKGFFRV